MCVCGGGGGGEEGREGESESERASAKAHLLSALTLGVNCSRCTSDALTEMLSAYQYAWPVLSQAAADTNS